MAVFHPLTARRLSASVITLGLMLAVASCTGDSKTTWGAPSSAPSISVPAPDPETSPPAPGGDYLQEIAKFCDAAAQTRASLQTLADTGAIEVAELVTVEQAFHDAFATLYAAHQTQFGSDPKGVEPLDAGFAVDAAIAILATAAQSDGDVSLNPGDPIFVHLDDVASGCASQIGPT